MYTFDDEFEARKRRAASTDALDVIACPMVAEVWAGLGDFLESVGQTDLIQKHLLADFFGLPYERYSRQVGAGPSCATFPEVLKLVEFDSGTTLRMEYDIIRLFHGHPVRPEVSDEFFALGMAGKFLDDMGDYRKDVERGSPNLLHALVSEHESERLRAESALAAGESITMEWWSRNCEVTYSRYMRLTFDYYLRVQTPRLRLPLDVYLALLRTQRYWTISTVRAADT